MKHFALSTLGFLLVLCPVPTGHARTAPGKSVETAVDEWLRPYVEAGDFSGVVLVYDRGSVLLQKAYGLADREHAVPNSLETRFRIGSISKTFTGGAIRMLVARGQLSLDDPLGRYVPGIPNGDRILVRHLLSHQSGVGEIDAADYTRACLSTEETLSRLRTTHPLFEPGADESYSNEGYFLLSVLIERVSGMPYERFLQKNIFDALGMKDSGSACFLPANPKNAIGYVPSATGVAPIPFAEAGHDGAGSGYSTAFDLYLWLRAVDTDPAFQVGNAPYGWGRRNYSGSDLIEQSGQMEGYISHIALYPKEHIYAVVLGNMYSGMLNRIPGDLEAILLGKGQVSRPPDVRPMTVPAGVLQDYIGAYRTASIPLPLNIVLKDGAMYQQWGQYPYLRALTPTGKDEFFYRHEYAEVRFERDAKGKVVRTVWQWPGGDPVVFDLVSGPPASPKPA